MTNLELLKTELKTQKKEIEDKGGTVIVANSNPSPSEITAGIKSIEVPDMTLATATAKDVVEGKTFYATNKTLKTGTNKITPQIVELSLNQEPEDSETGVFVLPGLYALRDYAFASSKSNLTINLPDSLESLGKYAFYKSNSNVNGLSLCDSLEKIDESCFQEFNGTGVNFEELPNTLTYIGTKAFYGSKYSGTSIEIPNGVTYIGNSAFTPVNFEYRYFQNLHLPYFLQQDTLMPWMFQYCVFNCDFVLPNSVKYIFNNFNYRGNFNNLTFHANLLQIKDNAFGSHVNDVQSNFTTQSITFMGETPPIMGENIFAKQNKEHDFAIYVPDTAVDEYKAVSYIAQNFSSYIKPMSQKP